MPVMIKCVVCDTDFPVKPSWVDRRKTCSRECSKKYKSSLEVYQNFKTGKEVPCAHCGKPTYKAPYKIKEKNYCSKGCTDKGKKGERTDLQTRIEVHCLHCDKPFKVILARLAKGGGKFCSIPCNVTYYSRIRSAELKPNVECAQCGTPFRKKPCEVDATEHHFCNVECMGFFYSESKMFTGENSPTWGGGKPSYYGPNWLPQRRAARERDDYTCQMCGITEEKYGQELSVHHKTPFRLFDNYEEANELDNLTSVCEPCHRIIHSGELHPTKYRDKVKI